MRTFVLFVLFSIMILPVSAPANAGELKVAVSANFKTTLDKIVALFEQQTQHKIIITVASSGTLFSQISHGAPFDVFLSADSERPQKLVAQNLALPESLFTYAIGQLVFWAPNKYLPEQDTVNSFIASQRGKLAIANPRLAPYGQSAYQYITDNALLPLVKRKLIKGNNVAQSFQFIESGNAESGIVSYSQLLDAGISNHYRLLPQDQYPAIKQQGVILKSSSNIALAKQLFAFIKHHNKSLILNAGYLLEDDNVS